MDRQLLSLPLHTTWVKRLHILQALVMASLDDFRRPLEKVSTTQSATLAATGIIWTRYCLIITPINYSLSLCNFMLGMANGVQCFRAYRHQAKTKTNN